MFSLSFFRTFSIKATDEILLDKFKGCILGGLIGDCYGKPYKLEEEVSKLQLQKHFDKLDGPYFKSPYKPYSSCTAFSKCLGESLLSKKGFDAVDVAKRFATTYFNNPGRDFGSNISHIVIKLRGSNFFDPFAPARKQYFGLGSSGNKAAARVSPVVLFYCHDTKNMINIATISSQLTHSNRAGIDGAVLHSWALWLALRLTDLPVPETFLEDLDNNFTSFKSEIDDLQLKDDNVVKKQLEAIKILLSKGHVSEDEVVNSLGHGKVAMYSVPTAIYCFLRAIRPIKGIDTDNVFRRTVQYAISLGGDTETIAGMAGALAGSCYGYQSVSQLLLQHCEDAETFSQLATELFHNRITTTHEED